MSKTLVQPAHKPGPLGNGADGCHARLSYDGYCPGVYVSDWLNDLGDDSQPFRGTKLTNGRVRKNWLRGFHHIKAVQ